MRGCNVLAERRTIDTAIVIAARFREWSRAQAALAALRARFGLRGDQAEAAVLASEGTGRPAVVAGQFHEDRIPEVETLITDQEGEIVADVPREETELRD